MRDFDRSKGRQTIYCSPATRDLLIAQFGDDLALRGNLKSIEVGQLIPLRDHRVQLVPSNHMLGAVQVRVETDNGIRVGYSGDLGNPIDEVIEVDTLVLDATYGSMDSKRLRDRAEVVAMCMDIVNEGILDGPVFLTGFSGAVHGFLHEMSRHANYPLVASHRRMRELQVYLKYGYTFGTLLEVGTDPCRPVLEDGHYVEVFGRGDPLPTERGTVTSLYLDARYGTDNQEITTVGPRSYVITYSDHADVEATLDYVKRTRAQRVITDGSRGRYAGVLAKYISGELGIEAVVSRPDQFDLE